jgi:hypothetical protein
MSARRLNLLLVICTAPFGHCEPSGLAFGEPKDKLREAISLHLRVQ